MCTVWHSILLRVAVPIEVCQQHTWSIWWSVWSQQDFPQIGPIGRQIDVRGEKTKSQKWSGSCSGTSAAVFNGQKIQTQSRWTAGVRALGWQVSLVDDLSRFILSALLHSYQFQHQLSKRERDGDAEMLFFSVTVAACSLWTMSHYKFWGNGLESSLPWKPVWSSVDCR